MTEHIKYPIEPEARPMGPLEEEDQALIDAIETIPPGHRIAYKNGERVIGISRTRHPGVREELRMSEGDIFSPKDRVYAHVNYRGISTECGGITIHGSHKAKYDSDRVSDGVIITHPTRRVPRHEAQARKRDAARAIVSLSQKAEAADKVVDVVHRTVRPPLRTRR